MGRLEAKMSEPRRIERPFVDQRNEDIVQAFFFDYVVDLGGSVSDPVMIVTIPAYANDLFGDKEIQSGIWTQREFKKRFKILKP